MPRVSISLPVVVFAFAFAAACGPTTGNQPDAGGPVCKIDGIKNGTETDTDCGGGCYTCGTAARCTQHTDCFSSSCLIGLCQGPTPTCKDTKLNNHESDIDCGGPNCEGCIPGKVCKAPTDCQSKVCTGGQCAVPTCFDGVLNALESGIDCGGGGMCARCQTGGTCSVGTDCDQGVCVAGECAAPTCMDMVRNATETDVDCGGVCGATCADLKMCAKAGDCINGICGQGACVPAKCTDNVKNGMETDVDCGGPSCAKCTTSEKCKIGGDCDSGVCTGGICQFPNCTDGVKNRYETDVDCGGTDCNPCADNQFCDVASDCQSKVCSSLVCQPPNCFDGENNGAESDVDCGQVCPQQCAWNYACFVQQDCVATVDCSFGTCSQCVFGRSDCNFSVNDGCESDTSSDLSNCGGCGVSCSTANGMASCASSICQIACTANYGDCDFDAQTNGCETNFLTDPNHCGGCNLSASDNDPCTTDTCVNGVAQHAPANLNDNNACTTDACTQATGITHTPIVCDDMNACTFNQCNPASGCFYPPIPKGFDFSTSTGWTLDTGWAIGPAVAGGGDPGTDHTPTTDNKLLGYIIGGAYSTTITSARYATSPIIDTSGATGPFTLEFWRWLTSDYPPYVYSTIDAWNGTSWDQIYNPAGAQDSTWTLVQLPLNDIKYRNPTFRIRFGFRVGSGGAFSGGGWNVDDIQLVGITGTGTCP